MTATSRGTSEACGGLRRHRHLRLRRRSRSRRTALPQVEVHRGPRRRMGPHERVRVLDEEGIDRTILVPDDGHAVRTARPDPRHTRPAVRARLPAGVQRLGRGLLPVAPISLDGGGDHPDSGHRACGDRDAARHRRPRAVRHHVAIVATGPNSALQPPALRPAVASCVKTSTCRWRCIRRPTSTSPMRCGYSTSSTVRRTSA